MEEYDEELQLEKVADAIKLIENDVTAVINSLTDKEIVELTRDTEKHYNEFEIDPYEDDEEAELRDAPLFREGIISFLNGTVPYSDSDNARVVRYLAKNEKIMISGQLSKDIDLLLDS
jgi:hypothetical protein